jgi:hypothetical protein
MKKSLLLFLTVFFSISLFSQEKLIIRFDQPDERILKEFTQPQFDVAAYNPGVYLDLVVTPEYYDELINRGFDVEVVNSTTQMAANLGDVDDINGYRTYDEAVAELQQIAADNPDICMLMDIGDSRGKEYFLSNYGNYEDYQHDIWAMKVSDNVNVEEDEPAVYYFGAHHAREPLSTEVAFYVLNHIIDNYGSDPEITENVNNTEIWFVPIVNPDGHEIVLDQINLDWRKNIRDNDGNGEITDGWWDYPDGVDPNRNYGWEFGGDGASGNPSDQTYHGPEAFSEPELQAIRDLMASEQFVAGISYHTYSELVLWPYGFANGATAPDVDAIADLGTMMGESIPSLYGGHYTPQASWQLYPAAGITDDWAYGKHGTFGYTIELATEFIPPANEVYQISEDNLEAALILLNRVNYSTLTGHVTNASTGDPVEAEIYIEGIDNTGMPREPYTSNEEFGTYYRLLTNGTYTVTVNAFGYISQTFDNVVITDDGQTILDVALVQSQIISVSGTITDADTGEPIEGAEIMVLNTPVDPVYTNENGDYQIPEIFENTYTFKVFAEDYATHIEVVTIDPQNNTVDFEMMESFAISFESGTFEPGWEMAGDADWFIDNAEAWDGSFSAKSGNIGDQSTTEIYYTHQDGMAGQISFFRKVSSESGYDYLQFYIDNQLQDEWAGEQDWEEFIYDVSEGTHTFKWVYEKDYSVSNGDDCAWIDYVTFPPAAALNATAGPNAEMCADDSYQCDGQAAFYESVEWTTSGDGEFSDDTILDPVYTPGTMDIQNGNATLTLTAFDGNGNEDSDDMMLTLNPMPAQGTDISGAGQVCAGNAETYTCPEIADADNCEWVLTPEEAGTIEMVSETEIIVNWTEGYFDEASLKVRGMNDCGYGEFSQEMIVSVEDCTGVGELEKSGFEIYPNPASDFISLNFTDENAGKTEIFVLNNLGGIVYQNSFENGNNISLNISGLEAGLYFVKAVAGENIYLRKVIIK